MIIAGRNRSTDLWEILSKVTVHVSTIHIKHCSLLPWLWSTNQEVRCWQTSVLLVLNVTHCWENGSIIKHDVYMLTSCQVRRYSASLGGASIALGFIHKVQNVFLVLAGRNFQWRKVSLILSAVLSLHNPLGNVKNTVIVLDVVLAEGVLIVQVRLSCLTLHVLGKGSTTSWLWLFKQGLPDFYGHHPTTHSSILWQIWDKAFAVNWWLFFVSLKSAACLWRSL